LTSDDLLNITTTLQVRALNDEVRVVVRMFNESLIGRLGKAIHNVYALSTSRLTAPILAMTAMTGAAIGAFRLEGHAEGGEANGEARLVAEVTVRPDADLAGRTIAEVTTYRDAVVLAHRPVGQPPRLLLEVDPAAH